MGRFGKGEYLGVKSIIMETVCGAATYVIYDPLQAQSRVHILRPESGTLVLLATVIGTVHDYQENQSDENLQT